jgi:uncharacterized membrane protein YozB (DUF420 family)
LKLSHKIIAVSTAVIVISLVTLAALSAETYTILQRINPIAAMAALVVIVAGAAWFRRAGKS